MSYSRVDVFLGFPFRVGRGERADAQALVGEGRVLGGGVVGRRGHQTAAGSILIPGIRASPSASNFALL